MTTMVLALVMLLAVAVLADELPTSQLIETEISRQVKLPPTIDIVPPGDNVPKEIVDAWLGRRWEGVWDFFMPQFFFVMEVGPKKVKAIYAWGRKPGQGSSSSVNPDFLRVEGKLINAGKISIYFSGRHPFSVVFELDDDGNLHGHSTPNSSSIILMKEIK